MSRKSQIENVTKTVELILPYKVNNNWYLYVLTVRLPQKACPLWSPQTERAAWGPSLFWSKCWENEEITSLAHCQHPLTLPVIDYIESTRSTVRPTILPELLTETWKWICKGMFLYHRLKEGKLTTAVTVTCHQEWLSIWFS